MNPPKDYKQMFGNLFKRDFKRHSGNKNIVLLDDISDFYRFGRTGIPLQRQSFLCPYDPFTGEEREEIEAFAKDRLKMDLCRLDHYQEIKITKECPPSLVHAADELCGVYEHLVGQKPLVPFLRLNSTYPQDIHEHPLALVYTFTGEATKCMNEDLTEEFTLPLRHIFAANRGVYHRASDYVSQTHPKIALIL